MRSAPASIDVEMAAEKAFWQQALDGAPAPATLPLDRERAPERPADRHAVDISLPADLCAHLARVTGGNPRLVYAAAIAAAATCLRAYSGARDVVLGAAHHRDHPSWPGAVPIVPLRLSLDPDASGLDLLEQTKARLSAAFARQRYPLDRIAEALGLVVQDRRVPLCDLIVVLEPLASACDWMTVPADVVVLLTWGDQAATGRLVYDPALFDADTVAVFARHLVAALASLLEDPRRAIGDTPIETAARLAWLHAARHPVPHASAGDPRTIVDLFTAQCERDAARVALVAGDLTWSYRELDARSSAIAHRLRTLRARAGACVAIHLDHSPELLAGIIGVMKSGAAFVPLDPGQSSSRRARLLSASGACALVTSRRLSTHWKGSPASTPDIVYVDEVTPRETTDDRDAGWAEPDQTAYVLFTSGSTGEPKGVRIRHDSLANYCAWAAETYVGGQPGAFALFTSCAFDLTLTSMFVPLITGHAIVIYPRTEPQRVLQSIVEDGLVDIVKLTPSHLALLADLDLRPSRLRALVVGGEALPTRVARRVSEALGREVEIFNEYGPTEATVGCMRWRFDAARETRAFVPIGHAAAGATIEVLDARMRPCPENATGDVYIGGPGLTEGYLGAEDSRGDAAFIPHPASPATRLYRTGDRARVLPGGSLLFAGRADEQIKVFGHRVELGEIRTALEQHPDIRAAVTDQRRDANGQHWLITGYVSDAEIDPDALASFLAARIPEEAIPQLFVRLPALPLTPNGKIDRGALPSLDQIRAAQRRRFVPPVTPAEQVLARICGEVLGIANVGLDDHIFELGGHSFHAVRIVSRLQKVFGVRLPLLALFEAPRISALIARLATHVDRARLEAIAEVFLEVDASSAAPDGRTRGAKTGEPAEHV